MKKYIPLFIFLLASVCAHAQTWYPVNNYQRIKGVWADGIMIAPTDTVSNKAVGSIANLNNVFYIKTTTAWESVSAVTTTLYNSNGALSGDRTVTMAGKTLAFNGGITSFQGYTPRLNTSYSPSFSTPADIDNGTYDGWGFIDYFPSGKWVIVYRQGVTHGIDAGDIVMRTSTDQGNTWSAATTILAHATYDLGGIGGGVTPQGRLLVMYSRNTWSPNVFVDLNIIYSDNEGSSWSSPISVPTTGVNADFTTSQAHVTAIADGKIMLNWFGRDTTTGAQKVFIIRSSDNGTTWGSAVQVVSSTTAGYSEPSFVHLDGGSILGLIRAENEDCYAQVKSTDNGDTWTLQGVVEFDTITGGAPHSHPELATFIANGKRMVACYYSNRGDWKMRAVYGDANAVFDSHLGWNTLSRIDLGDLANTAPGTWAGYISVKHPFDNPYALGWYYDADGSSWTNTIIKFVNLPLRGYEYIKSHLVYDNINNILTMQGNINLTGHANTPKAIQIAPFAGTSAAHYIGDDGGDFFGQGLTIATSALDGNGNLLLNPVQGTLIRKVGIGTPAPRGKLHTRGGGTNTSGYPLYVDAADSAWSFHILNNGSTSFPNLTSDPAGGGGGSTYFNSTSSKFRDYAGGAWHNRVLAVDTTGGNGFTSLNSRKKLIDSLHAQYVHLTGAETIAGEKTFQNGIKLTGGINVSGSTYALDLSTFSGTYLMAVPNNKFFRMANSSGVQKTILGLSSDNHTYLLSQTGSQLRLWADEASTNGLNVMPTTGNVVVNGTSDVASAKLVVNSTTSGFLPPRMTAAQASAISSPAEGLLVYVTDTNGTFTSKGWWGYNGAAWEKLNN